MNWVFIALLTALPAAAETPVEIANRLNTRGNQVGANGNQREAQRLYGESIAIWQTLGPAYEAHTASTMMNLAVAMTNEGNRVEASTIFEESLAMDRHSLGNNHLRTVMAMNLTANNHLMLGNAERAGALYAEALRIERELYPADIEVASTLEGMAYELVRRRQGRDALPLAEEALRIAIQSTGEESLDTALAYSSVAEAHRSMGSAARALPLYRRARALYRNVLGPNHPRVAALLSQEGLILLQDGKLALAEQAMTQSLKLLQTTCPACTAEQAIAESNLGLLRLRQRRYTEADHAFTAAIDKREKLTAHPGPELADALQCLAEVREKQHRLEDAARLNTRAEMIRGYR